jgi:hypothetical protein
MSLGVWAAWGRFSIRPEARGVRCEGAMSQFDASG